MSKQHPIIAITGSSGAGTSTVRVAMEHIFRRDGTNAALVEGDSFHRYDRLEMQRQFEQAYAEEPTGLYLYGIARAYQEAGERALAQDYFRKYVGLPADEQEPEPLKKAKQALEALYRLKSLSG